MKKDIIKEIIIQNQDKDYEQIFERKLELPINSNKIISVSGVRRSGKTSLLFLTVKKLLTQGVDKKQLIIINFEDERLSLKTSDLDLIIQSYVELFPNISLKNTYFFFDEVQNIVGWEKFVRRLYDNYTKNIFITGSNSQMLSSELSTSLRGRNLNFEMFPLTFSEFLSFNNIEQNYYLPQNKAQIINYLKKYLISGGFPELIFIDENFHDKTLQSYYYLMLYKDLIERYKIKNSHNIDYLIKRLLTNLTKPTSINKIYNEMKSVGLKISKDTIYQLIEYFEAIYFSFTLNKFDYSLKKQKFYQKKLYFIDNGLINALTFEYSNNYGKLLENTIFIYLRNKYGENVFFYKEKKECDFVVFEKDRVKKIIQVSYDIAKKETFDREIAGLIDACRYFKTKKGTIITFESEQENIYKNGVEIQITSAYKFLLDSNPDKLEKF